MTTTLLPTGRPRIGHLEMRQIVKRFPGVIACDHVDFDVRAGEVHALLGENGAGKSTLMRQLYGLYHPDAGEIHINGEAVTFHSPTDAIEHGIGMIHQHFMLVDELTVTENVALGMRSSRGPLLDLDKVEARIRELSQTYGLQVDPKAPVWTLAVGECQRVEIIKALYRGAALLILDEPTAVLTPQEADDLFVTLHQMKRDGHALIFISHKLREVVAISDRISVLRGGRLVDTVPNQGITRAMLARMMVGRDVLLERTHKPLPHGAVRLALRGVSAVNVTGQPALRDVTLEIHAGEILGVAGVSGNGQRELAEVVAGLRGMTGGCVELDGHDASAWQPGKRTDAGLAYIPEERMHDGIVQEFSVSENLVLQDYDHAPMSNGILLNFGAIAKRSRELVRDFNIRTPSIDTATRSLSGGNIQKLILARELSRDPKVLVAAQPTRGVDIGATEYIHQRLLDQRGHGAAILLISEDLDEILALADRIAVIYEGRIMAIVPREEATAEQLGLLMAGVTEE
ncbi:ABC transporter ATP-binding protein [Caldilinea sp.]|uniref:ABC transporter ATP-binding protein n=1 Tax=Caldilinea sp. TaxID=2293560 RepID=UPI002BAE7B2F|nr:ABC transporter ATP-binding protein [Anaerolineales bacterium]HQY91992.1 ABC transporter ATP-binding protein [Caldilinea sp.]